MFISFSFGYIYGYNLCYEMENLVMTFETNKTADG